MLSSLNTLRREVGANTLLLRTFLEIAKSELSSELASKFDAICEGYLGAIRKSHRKEIECPTLES